jgi:hypothetical protein
MRPEFASSDRKARKERSFHEGEHPRNDPTSDLAGSDLQRFRVVDVNIDEPPADTHGVFTVERVEG